jgi:hypothetical protein
MKKTSEIPFEWERPCGVPGYAWQSVGESSRKMELRPQANTRFEVYRPLESPIALYRELAKLDCTEDAVAQFANRYGLLHASTERAARQDLTSWTRPISDMRECVLISDMLRASDKCGLADLFVFEGGCVHYRDPRNPDLSPGLVGHDLGSVKDGDLMGAAGLMLNSYLGIYLARQTGFAIYWERSRFVFDHTPLSLLGAIFFQLAQAIVERKEPRACVECGRWFDVAPGTARADRVTCSTGCRSKIYRQRQETARRLHEAGKKPKQIAAELDSDVATVKKWLEVKGGK